jgi:glyoxylase-like metal-dependent hydrolase (beta-lactamase superfamily II)
LGQKRPTAKALRDKLAANGVSFSDVRRIVLTHAHEDHCGLAKQVRDESKNAEILVHDWETGQLFGRLSQEHHKRLLLRSGVPARIFEEMRGLYDKISLLTDALDDGEFLPLKDEMELEFENGSLRVIHTPGHTPGSCSFAREANRTLICGDCVLKRITPNPIVSLDPVDPELVPRLPSTCKPRKATRQTYACLRRA